MATSTKRSNPSRTTNNNGAAVRTPASRFNAKHYSDTIKALRAVGKRGNSLCDHMSKTYDELQTIGQTLSDLAMRIEDGDLSPRKVADLLRKTEDRVYSAAGRLNYSEMGVANIAGDADWIADGNSISND